MSSKPITETADGTGIWRSVNRLIAPIAISSLLATMALKALPLATSVSTAAMPLCAFHFPSTIRALLTAIPCSANAAL
ncbi:hypothetical protein D3C76_1521140 [compost metagenome]